MSRTTELSGSSYNISLNFSSIGSLFSFPSRLLSRIRGIDSNASVSFTPLVATTVVYSPPTPQPTPAQNLSVTRPSTPGPWGFFTSGYMIGLVLMMVLMHRIEHIVMPTRVSHFPMRFSNLSRSRVRRFARRIYNMLLPFDMDNTATRFALHLPTLYLLSKSLLLWSMLLLKAVDLTPDIDNPYVAWLQNWSESKEMKSICWQTFCSICGAFCVEAFVKGLDGVSVGFGAAMQANTSPFNLVGYAFLLYAYSSSYTHVIQPDGLPSRPDKHVLLSITIPLIQLTMFHFLSVRKRWSSHRFIPTAISSFISLLHFHITIFSHAFPGDPMPHAENGRRTYSSPTGAASYPILNYIPNTIETVLVLMIVLTIFLNTITQLLLTGRVTKPLLGLGLSAADGGPTEGWSWSPPWEEDFGVVLLRVGIASLEATGLRGWGNEALAVVASLPSDTMEKERFERGSLKMNRNGVVHVFNGSVTTTTRGSLAKTSAAGNRVTTKVKLVKGLNNEIRDVDLGDSEARGRRRVCGIPGFFTVNREWWSSARALVVTLKGVFLGFFKLLWDLLRGRKTWSSFKQARTPAAAGGVGEVQETLDSDEDAMIDETTYHRFIRGEQVSDDEDEDDEWSEEGEVLSDDEVEVDSDGEGEAVALYHDLQARATSPEAASSAMLAHMAYGGSSPMTRRRYGALLAPPRTPEPLPPPQVASASSDDSESVFQCVTNVEKRWLRAHLLLNTDALVVVELSKDTPEYLFLEMFVPFYIVPILYPSLLAGYENEPPLPTGFNADGKSLVNLPPGATPPPLSKAYDEFPDPLDKENNGFDFHIYFMHTVPGELKYAQDLHERIRREFPELRIYRLWDKPIGPHPTGMFEVNTFNPHQTGTLFSWLVVNRGPCSVLVHPNTGDAKKDHTELVTWIGKPWPLRTDIL